jgi:glycosyltransferase involved in cell wall biosynthesis
MAITPGRGENDRSSCGALRIAIVSPFLDKRHGTERCVVEELERLARTYGHDVHVYSQRVEDLAGVQRFRARSHAALRELSARESGAIFWHKVPSLPGPHLVKYLWWFIANHVWRWWDRHVRGLRYDLVYSPGVNCLDADVVSVHILFAELHRRIADRLRMRFTPMRSWLRLLHRRLYYRVIRLLERQVYSKSEVVVIAVSQKVREDMQRHYPRPDPVPIVYPGVDTRHFNPHVRAALRPYARRTLHLSEDTLALLLIGNDWKKKGLDCLVEAAGQLQTLELRVLVVGRDDPAPYRARIRRLGLSERISFLPPRPDVEFYYAAADVYVGPSVDDAFALPPMEAMACGVPVIVSRYAGVSELITHGVNGLILDDPRNVEELADGIRRIAEDAAWREHLGRAAVHTVAQYTWDRHAQQVHEIFSQLVRRHRSRSPSEDPRARLRR